MVTLKDIAKSCGVSRGTVSKALNGYGDVGRDTVKLIQTRAKEMGYVPNLAARSLKTNRAYSLGILFSDQLGSGLKHEYFNGILNSFKTEAESRGYSITFISDRPGGKQMSFLEQCRYRNFDGVLIACADYEDAQLIELVKSDLPTVTTDCVFSECSSVLSDNVLGMRELMEYAFSCGHRKIAYIHGDMTAVTNQRLKTYYKCCQDFGIDPPKDWVLPARYRDSELCAELTLRLMSQDERPTCILYPDDCALMGGIRSLNAMGLRIPEDISIAGYDGSYIADILSPKLTTVFQDTETMGRTAARLLVEAIENEKTWLPEQVTIPGHLIKGETMKKLSV